MSGTSPEAEPYGLHRGVVAQTNPNLARHQGELARHLDRWLGVGSQALAGSLQPEHDDWTLASKLLLRRALELLGGISAQVRGGWAEAALPSTRALLELTLYMEYLTSSSKSRDELIARGYCFLVGDIYEQLRLMRGRRRDTEEGKQLAARLSKDRALKNSRYFFEGEEVKLLEFAERELVDRLGKPGYRDAAGLHEDWKQRRASAPSGEKKKHRRPKWYTLRTPDAKNVESLARHLGRLGEYDMMYRELSGATHSSDVHRQHLEAPCAPLVIRKVRWPGDGQRVTLHASMFIQEVLVGFVKLHSPEEFDELLSLTTRLRVLTGQLITANLLQGNWPPATME